MAISIDWYIATDTWDSEWISENDIEIFNKITSASDCVIIGNTTYKQYKWEIYPISNIHNIVVSNTPQENKNNISFSNTPEHAIALAKSRWYTDVILVWWWHINGSFLSWSLINEIIIDIQPIILWTWVKLFEKFSQQIQLEFIEHKAVNWWLNILKYKVTK